MDPHGDQGASSGNATISARLLELYRAAASGDYKKFDRFKEGNAETFPVTSDKDNVLHVATKFKRKEVVEIIIHSQPSLVYEKNSKDGTPLHIAARLGCLEIAELLIYAPDRRNREAEADEKLTRMVNKDNDTALHVAARHGHFEIVKLLIQKDPELTNRMNSTEDSPLFLALDRGFFNIAAYILQATEHCPCPYKGRDNKNVLHTAVIRTHKVNQVPAYIPLGYNWRWLLHFLRQLKLFTSENFGELNSLETDVINKLMQRYPSAITETDDFGWTPLHYAAHLGHHQTVRMFLSTSSSLAYVQDEEGMSILHVAAKEDRVTVMRTLIDECPDMCKLLDREGRTALHVAAETGKDNAVKYVLKTPNLECLINEQDNRGNLPNHLAAMKGHFGTAAILGKDSRIDKGAMNKDGLTAVDIIQSSTKLKFIEKIWLTRFLEESGGLRGLKQVVHRECTKEQNSQTKEPGEIKEPVNQNDQQGKPDPKRTYTQEHLKDIAQTSLLEATIIATVTFQAVFQLPGGTGDSAPFRVRPVLLQNPRFKAFMITDALAFVCSTFSMSIHFWATVRRNQRKVEHLIKVANVFTYLSILAMVAAFIEGTSAVLPEAERLYSATFYIGCSFFLLHSYFLFSS